MRGPLHAAEDAEAFGELRADQPAEEDRERRFARLLVVDQNVVHRDSLTELDRLRLEAVEAQTLVAILAEQERSAMLQVNDGVGLDARVGGVFEYAVVENLAVLINLDERGPFVRGRL